MPRFPELTQPKVPVNVEENGKHYEPTEEFRMELKGKEAAAAEQMRKQLFQQHFGTPKKGGRRTRKARRKAKKSRRRK